MWGGDDSSAGMSRWLISGVEWLVWVSVSASVCGCGHGVELGINGVE